MQTKHIISFILLTSTLLFANEYTLQNLCKKGIENNSKIKSFSYKTLASHSYYDQSIDQYKPHFTIDGQIGQQKYTLEQASAINKYDGTSYQYQFTLNQPIYRAKLIYAIDDADARIILAKLLEEDEKAKLITQILQTSFELIKLKKTIKILKQKENILQKAYLNIEKKHAMKLASKVEQSQSLSMLKQSQSDLVIAMQTYDHTVFNLKMLTQTDDVEKYVKSLKFNIKAIQKAFKKINIVELKSKYHQNTRINLEKQTIKLAEIQIDLRGAERYPNIDAVLSYGDTGGTIDATVRQDDSRAMLKLNFPLYQGGYVTDRVEEARYLLLSAQSNAEDIEINIKISLEKRIQDILSGLQSANAERVAVQASKKYFEATTESYRNGLGNLTDAYLAESDYHDNRLRLVNIENNIFISLAEIYYYSGILDYTHIKELQQNYLN